MQADIRNFFGAYRNTFNSLDGEELVKVYAIHSGLDQPRSSCEAIRDSRVALSSRFLENGVSEVNFEQESLIEQGEHYAVANTRWLLERYDGNPSREFNTTYNRINTAEGWRTSYSNKGING